jgi:hypothetical protein
MIPNDKAFTSFYSLQSTYGFIRCNRIIISLNEKGTSCFAAISFVGYIDCLKGLF